MRRNNSQDETREKCPHLEYCVDSAGLPNMEICHGINGDYPDCACFRLNVEKDERGYAGSVKSAGRK